VGVTVTTIGWFIVTYLTRPTDEDTLLNFCKLIRPGGPGWEKVKEIAIQRGVNLTDIEDEAWRVPQGILCMVLGCIVIYGILLATGYWIYGNIAPALLLTILSLASAWKLKIEWKKLVAISPYDEEG
jgi:solute:Na+ symporter, SSS family